jgi:hypothetical protein
MVIQAESFSLFTAALSIHNVYKEGSCCFYFSPRQLPLSRGVLKGGDLLFLPLSLSAMYKRFVVREYKFNFLTSITFSAALHQIKDTPKTLKATSLSVCIHETLSLSLSPPQAPN